MEGELSGGGFLLPRLAGRFEGAFEESSMYFEEDLVAVSSDCSASGDVAPYPLLDIAVSPPLPRAARFRLGSGGDVSADGMVFCLLDLRGEGGFGFEGSTGELEEGREGALRFLDDWGRVAGRAG